MKADYVIGSVISETTQTAYSERGVDQVKHLRRAHGAQFQAIILVNCIHELRGLKGQIDSSARIIKIFEKLGWVWDARWPSPERIEGKRVDDYGGEKTLIAN